MDCKISRPAQARTAQESKTMTLSAMPLKFCKKCKVETERYSDGRCKPCKNAYDAAWRAANPGKVKAGIAVWRAANPEKVNTSAAAWRAANREKKNAYSAAWRAANPEAVRIHKQNHRALARANGGVLSNGLSAKLFKLQKGKCPCCGKPLGKDFHLDHKTPLALGGSNTDDNMQLLRQRCNSQKGAKHPTEFMQSRGFLL